LSKNKRPRWIGLVVVLFYILLIITPPLNLLLYPPEPSSSFKIEALNGLLTGSSIFFGFAVLPIGERKTERLLWLMTAVDVFLLALNGVLFLELESETIKSSAHLFLQQ
jgi:hypothetical protein